MEVHSSIIIQLLMDFVPFCKLMLCVQALHITNYLFEAQIVCSTMILLSIEFMICFKNERLFMPLKLQSQQFTTSMNNNFLIERFAFLVVVCFIHFW